MTELHSPQIARILSSTGWPVTNFVFLLFGGFLSMRAIHHPRQIVRIIDSIMKRYRQPHVLMAGQAFYWNVYNELRAAGFWGIRSPHGDFEWPSVATKPLESPKARTTLLPRKMDASWEILLKHPNGAIIAVRVAGTYVCETFSAEVGDFVRSAIAAANAAAVIIDLTGLEFDSGDDLAGLGALMMPLVKPDGELRPAALLAIEQSAQEMEWLFAPNLILGLAGIKLVHNQDEALDHVQTALGV